MTNRIKELREARGLTQQGLAELVGTTKQQIGRLESSKRRLHQDWISKLSKALGCAPADIFEATATLSPQEQAMLGLFRGLSPEDQSRIIKITDALTQHDDAGNGRKAGNGQ